MGEVGPAFARQTLAVVEGAKPPLFGDSRMGEGNRVVVEGAIFYIFSLYNGPGLW